MSLPQTSPDMAKAQHRRSTISAPPIGQAYSSRRRPWDASVATVLSRSAACDVIPPGSGPTVSAATRVARPRQRLSSVFPQQTVRPSERPPRARSPVPISPPPRTFFSHATYLDHQIRVIIPTPALSRLGPPKTLQRAKIERGCRDNASNFFWVRLVHTS